MTGRERVLAAIRRQPVDCMLGASLRGP